MWIFQLLQLTTRRTAANTGPISGPVLGLFMFLFLILVLFLVLDTQVHLSRSSSCSCYHLWLCVCWCISRWHNCMAKTGPLLRFMFCFAAVDKADDCIYRPGGERKGRRNWLKGELGKRLITHDTCSNILGNPQNGGPKFWNHKMFLNVIIIVNAYKSMYYNWKLALSRTPDPNWPTMGVLTLSNPRAQNFRQEMSVRTASPAHG